MPLVKIIDVPAGEAPEWVREKWVGLLLPTEGRYGGKTMGVLGGSASVENHNGFKVSGKDALEVLQTVSPEAASWWRQNIPSIEFQFLVFGAKFCCLVDETQAV